MKSISDILNSMVQPIEQNPLLGGNQSVSNQGSNPSVGSFANVLSQLTAQSSPTTNAMATVGNNNAATNSNTPSAGLPSFSDTQITVTEVQVSEKIQSGNLSPTDLNNIENAVASLAMALAQLIHLASNLQNLNPTQAQNLLVTASGGAISASQAQQLVAQITALKNQQNNQNPLSLSPDQQDALLIQMFQSMFQNQQVSLTLSAETQNNQSSSQGFSSIQFNFSGNQSGQNGNAQIEDLSVNIKTLDLQLSSSTQTPSQGTSSNAAPSVNLTDAATQKLTQLLQQLNVTPSSTPVNIQVQSSVTTTNSPELAKNFQNLVQILTQAGAGQAVLSNFLTQHKNDVANNNLQQALNQPVQPSNGTVIQSAAVTAVNSANSDLISNDNKNDVLTGQEQPVNNSSENENIQLPLQNAASSLPVISATNVNQNLPVQSFTNLPQSIELAGNNVVQPSLVGVNTAQNELIQLVVNQQSSSAQAANIQTQPITIVKNLIPNTISQPSDNQPQPIASTVNISGAQALVLPNENQNGQILSMADQQPQASMSAGNNLIQPELAVIRGNQSTQTQPINDNSTRSTEAVGNETIQPELALTNGSQTTLVQPGGNSQIQSTPVVTSAAQNTLVQLAANNQPQPINPTINSQNPQAPVVVNTIPVQPSNDVRQPVATVIGIQAPQAPATIVVGQNAQDPSAANTGNQKNISESDLVFVDGQLEALNGIVARFNSAIVSAAPTDNNNILNNINPSIANPSGIPIASQIVPVQSTIPVTNVVQTNADIVLAAQNTQQTSNLTNANVQNQLTQPTSSTTQQIVNDINTSTQNSFVQTGVNTTVNNDANTAVGSEPQNASGNVSTTIVNQSTPVISIAPAVQQIVTANQTTVPVTVPSSNSASAAMGPLGPVVTQPVTTPVSMTAQNVLAATVAGETAKAAIPVQTPSNANSTNAPVIADVSSVPAVQPITAQGVTQVVNNSESSANLNVAENQTKNTSADTTNLQNLIAAVNASVTTATDKTGNSFQTAVNSVPNNNPNGSVDSAQVLSQITQQVAAQTADAKMVSRLNFQLVPESLGRVNIQVALVDQSISARIIVTNPDVREVLQQHMVDLKAALSQAGLQIDQMQVQVQGGGSNLLAQYYQYQQEGNSYRESAWTPSGSAEQVETPDNLSIFTPSGSNALLNLLV